MHRGADIMSGRRTTNATAARPRIARLRSTILRVRRGGADTDVWFMPPIGDGNPLRWRMRFPIHPRYTESSASSVHQESAEDIVCHGDPRVSRAGGVLRRG